MDFDLIDESQTEDGGVWAYPDVGDNLDKPESARAAALIRMLTGQELQKQRSTPLVKHKRSSLKDVIAESERRLSKEREQMLRSHVKRLRNFFVRDEKGARTELTKIDQLIDVALSKHTKQGAQMMLDVLNAIYALIVGGSQLSEDLQSE